MSISKILIGAIGCLALSQAVSADGPFWRWTGNGSSSNWSDAANWDISTFKFAPSATGVFFDKEGTEEILVAVPDPVSIADLKVAAGQKDETLIPRVSLSGSSLSVLQYFGVGLSMAYGYSHSGNSYDPSWRYSQLGELTVNDMAVKVGEKGAPALWLGVGAGVSTDNGSYVHGVYSQNGGSFEAYTRCFSIGRSNATGSPCSGVFDLATVASGTLIVTNLFDVGIARDKSLHSGSVVLGDGWTVEVGTKEDAAAKFAVGSFNTSYGDMSSCGRFYMPNGKLSVVADKIEIGNGGGAARAKVEGCVTLENATEVELCANSGIIMCYGTGAVNSGTVLVTGILDIATCENIRIDTPSFTIGTFSNARNKIGRGIVRLGEGEGRVGDLQLGDVDISSYPNVFLLLELNGFGLSVTNSLSFTGIISNNVCGVSSGLILTDAAAEAANFAGKMNISFARDPQLVLDGEYRFSAPGSDVVWYWGLKWAGNRVDAIGELLAAEKLSVDLSGLSAAAQERYTIYYSESENMTYLGVPLRKDTGLKIFLR